MSKIIKKSDLVLSHPRVIQFLDNLALEQDFPEVEEILIPALSELDQEKIDIELLKKESQTILAETEQLVMGLLEKARNEAKNIINDAREEAEVIRAQVQEEAQRIQEQAGSEGYSDGLKKAQAEIEADRQMAIEQSQSLIEEARRTKIAILDSVENDIVRLAMAIAKKVVVAELSSNPRAIVDIVRQAISFLDNPYNVRVYVNPADLQYLLDSIANEGLTEIGSADLDIEVKADRRISSGGCIVDSSMG
ncbi:MAG: FliH/SctL family protein, partial [Syntrophomonadaceae bacterium]|nr:FliH/SctL family protein [Syntrophomonadaceae bacterium]